MSDNHGWGNFEPPKRQEALKIEALGNALIQCMINPTPLNHACKCFDTGHSMVIAERSFGPDPVWKKRGECAYDVLDEFCRSIL
jgi:hypothetical protein